MSEQQPSGITFWVNGIVAQRDKRPYVQLSNDKGMIGQFTIAETRNVAFDLLRSASYAEVDAMLYQFFAERGIEAAALTTLMMDFRDFREKLDTEKVERSTSDPEDRP
jgi:hypothetical protein